MLCYSGGKDSEVVYDLAIEAGVKFFPYYSLMPDPPELIRHIKKHRPETKIVRPIHSFWEGCSTIFPPNRKNRWCCRIIKENPSKSIPLSHRLLGIRAEESPSRARRGWINRVTKKNIAYHPIFDWNEADVWDYIEYNNIPYCSLYDEGFSRLGCIVCPWRTNTKSQELWKERYPQYFKLFEKKCYQWWERIGFHREGVRGYAKLFDEFLDNWYRGK